MRPTENLRLAIKQLPAKYRPAIEAATAEVEDGITRRLRIKNLVQKALSELRLDVKYLLFDLECTKRERDEARTS